MLLKINSNNFRIHTFRERSKSLKTENTRKSEKFKEFINSKEDEDEEEEEAKE